MKTNVGTTCTRVLVTIFAVALAVTACSPSDSDGANGSGTESAESPEIVEVSYLTGFSTFGREAYVFVAEELGFFDDEGLDVDINSGTGTVDVLRLIAAGTADFGIGDSATGVITIADQGLPVQSIAGIHQQSMAALVALESSGISEPADIAGATYGDAAASTMHILLPLYAEAAGFDDTSVDFIPSSPPDLPRLLASGQVDIIGQFVAGRGLIESAAEEPAIFFPYADYIPDLYGNFLFARSQMIENEPEVVERFLRALLRGLEYSIENPGEAAEILASHVPEQDPQLAMQEIEIMAPYVLPDGFTGGIGDLEPDRIDAMLDALTQAGALESDVSAADVATVELLPER